MKKKLHFLRLASLFAVLAVSTQASGTNFWNWLRSLYNSWYNSGDMYYSQLTTTVAIGEGKVYAEWPTTGMSTGLQDRVNSNKELTITVSSPNNDTARSANKGQDHAVHNYVTCAIAETDWVFEDWYTDVNCNTKYTPKSSQSYSGITGYQVVINSYSKEAANRDKLTIYARFALKGKLNSRGYSTLYWSNYNFRLGNDGVVATTYKIDGNKLVESKVYGANQVIPAREAVVLSGAANKEFKLVPVVGTYPVDPNNALRGTDGQEMTTGGDKYYVLSYNQKRDQVGFFYMTEDGGAFLNGAHKAYLPVTDGSDIKGFDLNGEDDATGINDIDAADEANSEIYNLAGQRINQMQRGINIVNGKKILKK